jgi:PGF-pre-PGF domain-containing protein
MWGQNQVKIKTDYFNLLISNLLIILVFFGITPSIVSALDDDVDELPDLIIEDVSFNPENPEPGQTVTITATVKNQGVGASRVTNLVYYNNGDNIGEKEVPSIQSGENRQITLQWDSEIEGTVEVSAKVDEENSVVETEENNNERTEMLTFKKTDLPDLVIEGVSFNPENPESGQEVTITATVKNQGNVASGTTNVEYYSNEAYLGKSEVLSIEAGQSEQTEFLWGSGTESTVEITAKADSGNSVPETDENNNERTETLTINTVEGPDLTIEDFSFDPTNPEPGQTVNITAIVKNQGTITSEATNLEYHINGNRIDEREVPSIEAGQDARIRFSWEPETEGTVQVSSKIDARNSVLETNEDNNERVATLTVAGNPGPGLLLPDLIINDIVPEVSAPHVGKLLNITLKVRNQGTALSETTVAKYYINGTESPDISIPPLPVENEAEFIFSLTPEKEGPIEIRGLVDPGRTLNESNEMNNELTKIINVIPVPSTALPPDLTIDSLSVSPTSPAPGENITFTATIKNNGTGNSLSSTLTYNINGASIATGEIAIPALTAGEVAKRTFFLNPAVEGQIEVKLVIDSGNTVRESDEINNGLTKTVKVTKKTTSGGGSGSGSSSKSKSSSGGMGGGVSAEPARNVAAKELATRHVISGYHMRYDFPEKRTCVEYIEYDAKRTFKRTTTTVEVLKDKSTLVSNLPAGRIYKHVNIWVGEKGAGLPDAIENGIIGFRIEKAWLKSNNFNESLVTLQWYYDKNWQLLSTEKVGDDQNYVYFKAKTPGYSSFSITEYIGIEESKEENNTQVEENKTQVGATMQGLLGSFTEGGKEILNVSAEKKENKANKFTGTAKIIMAISLPLLMILIEFVVLRKKL